MLENEQQVIFLTGLQQIQHIVPPHHLVDPETGKGKAVAPPSEHSIHSDSDTRESDDSASDSGGSSDQGGIRG